MDQPVPDLVSVTPNNNPVQPQSVSVPVNESPTINPIPAQPVTTSPLANQITSGVPKNSPTSSFQPPTVKLPPVEEPTFTPRPKTKITDKVLMAAGPLFMVGALTFSFITINKNQSKPAANYLQQATKETEYSKTKYSVDLMIENCPQNPDQVKVTCQSTGEPIESGQPTSCPDPTFEWIGERVKEPGTQITGYYVYFGPEHNDLVLTPSSSLEEGEIALRPETMGSFQQSNLFSPQNLEAGQKYYLAVQAVSDSQTPDWRYGLEVVDQNAAATKFANILFTYDYQP